ncbi:MAG: glycosyltransferase family 2 protein [Ilumatobacteraceae bacterium]
MTTFTRSPAPLARIEPADSPDVSVVIVAYGTGRVIVETIASLSTAATDLTIEVIVVDNPHPAVPGRSAMELSLSTAGVQVVAPGRNLGFGGGCEAGALVARADVLAFVNPDVLVPDGWLEPLVAALDTPGVAIAVPVLVDPDDAVQEAGQRVLADGATVPIRHAPDHVTTVDYASGACWVVTARMHERLGGFDPLYHPAYFEDVDLALRARSMGLRCVVEPAVRVVHLGGQGTPDRIRPASAQRDILLQRWPDLRWRQPPT